MERCEYCNGKKGIKEIDGEGYADINTYVGGATVTRRLKVYLTADMQTTWGLFDINFCPMCGRKLNT